jgi:two-component system, cell cycle response regulator DivK
MRGQKIFVAEDNPTVRLLFDAVLTLAGYRVVTAASGAEALTAAEAEEPDLIVMDCQMPGLSGLEVATRLRQNPGTRNIPVLGVTGGTRAELDELIAAGYTACVLKPISLDKLYEAVAELLRGPMKA